MWGLPVHQPTSMLRMRKATSPGQWPFSSPDQRPRSLAFWSAPRIVTSGQVQHRKSAIHGLPVTLRMHVQSQVWQVMLVPRGLAPQRSPPRIATSGQVQQRKSAIHGLPVTLRMLRVKSGKSDWFWSQSIVFTKSFKTGMSLDLARGRDSWCWPKEARPLGTRMLTSLIGFGLNVFMMFTKPFKNGMSLDLACVADRQNRQYSPSAQRLPKACSDIPLFVYPVLIG